MARTTASARSAASARTAITTRIGGVFNGGFEIGTGSATTGWIGAEAYGWRVNDTTGTASFDSTTSHSGSQSLKAVKSASAGTFSINNINDSDLTTLPVHGTKVIPSTSYTLTCWYKTDGVTGPRIQCHGYTASAWVETYFNTVLSTPTDWTLFTATFTTGASVVNLAIVPGRYNDGEGANGTVSNFDDINLQLTSRSVIA